uniref:Uncharacterized protein n=1 Tax=viral metagenome TaxID=1070528 RepID=A0A6C0JLV9_9ZZZZ
MAVKNKYSSFMTLENIIGLLLAILILFDLKVEEPISKLLNTPVGLTMSLLVVIIMFYMLNPVVGILFLIYLYKTIKYDTVYSGVNKDKILQKMNPTKTFEVEEQIILERAPIKNQNQNNNVSFKPTALIVGSEL